MDENAATLFTAIPKRISTRAYDARPIEQETITLLEEYVAKCNDESELDFQLYGVHGSTAKSGAIDLSPKMFAPGSVNRYAALVANDNEIDGDKVGYFGEKLVLFATSLGLGTCWVASTYDKTTVRADLSSGDNTRLWDVIPLGYAAGKTPAKQKMIRAALRRADKKPAALVNSMTPFEQLPEWFRGCLDAVIAGPSAINGQPVVFDYVLQSDGKPRISANIPDFKRDVQLNDLGIAKLHFQLAAAAAGIEGTWEWGRGGEFKIA